jgi:hypothetical protein
MPRSMLKKEDGMDNLSVALQDEDEEILAYSVSDDDVENAAALTAERVGSFTLSFCSGLETCPA